jgi:hypothetical protein
MMNTINEDQIRKKKKQILNKGVVYEFQSKNNCSVRTKIASKVMKQKMKEINETILNRKRTRSIREKEATLKKITNIFPGRYCIKDDFLNKYKTFFTNVSKKTFRENYGEVLSKLKLKLKIKLVNKMRIVDNINGAKMMEESNVPVFLLCPRDKVLCNTGSSHIDVKSISNLLLKYNKLNLRGKKCTGLSNNYMTLGAHCNRYGKGFKFSVIHPDYMTEYNHIKNKILKRVFVIAKQFLPTGLLSNLKEIKEIVGDTTSIHGNGFENVWSSIASSCNYVSPAHTDKDAFISCLLVTHKPKNTSPNEKYFYSIDNKVCCHFIFPEYGTAVALRPGDILFFNPLHYHCLSDKTVDYIDQDVYVSSFYMKSAQIGLNDNDIPVSGFATNFL